MEEIEISAKTVDEAIQTALEQLGVENDQVEVVVLNKGRLGLLGMGSEDAKVKVKLLAEKNGNGDVVKMAREVLDKIIEFMGLSAKVTTGKSETDSLLVTLDVEGDDLGILIGRHGQTLTSLQYIVRLIVAEKSKMWVPFNIDVAGYKKRRYDSLRNLALRVAEQVKRSQRMLTLEPMPADERRIVHITLASHPDVATQSMGEGEMRKVAVMVKKR
jgi:spoIIIJ-associated protein